MRYTRSKESEKAFLDSGRFMSSWEVGEKKIQSKMKKKAKRKGKKKK